MAKIIEMPKLSDTMKEGGVAEWMLKEGDKVVVGVPVVKIETDKATMEYESPYSGILLKILAPAGEIYPLATPLAVVGKAGEDWQISLKESLANVVETSKPEKRKELDKPAGAETAASPSAKLVSSQRIRVSPLARRIADERVLDLAGIKGSGPMGRIVMRDVTAVDLGPVRSATVVRTESESIRIPISMMRKTIASRVSESMRDAPHFYVTIRANAGSLLKWRRKVLPGLAEDKKFSFNDIIVFLVARALKVHPEINSSWGGDHIIQYMSAHIGIAVALEQGLVTPVIRDACSRSVIEIAQQSRELVQLAREGKLPSDASKGGTFSISNLGMHGIESFTAIINPPQSAILAVGAVTSLPVVDSDGKVQVEDSFKLTLSCDHRVIDGAMAAVFLKTLKSYIEDPMSAVFL